MATGQLPRAPFSRMPATPQFDPAALQDLAKRLRLLEQRMATLQRQLQVNEQNLIAFERKDHAENRGFRKQLTDLNADFTDSKEHMELVAREVSHMASRDDVEVLKRYLDLWEPVKFVSQTQVEKIVREILAEKGKP